MKKNSFFLPFLCLALFLVSCGSSSSKNEKEKINYDYQGACYENDFEKAHLIINKRVYSKKSASRPMINIIFVYHYIVL